MPELPEVETVRRSLEPLVVGQEISSVDIHYGGNIKKPQPDEFCRLLAGRQIKSLKRRGKYLLFELSGEFLLVIHLRMTGQLMVCYPEVPLPKHTHLIFNLSGGQELRFTDIRKFGLVYLIPAGKWNEIGGLYNLGPEPLEEEFTFTFFEGMIKKHQGGLKAFLLNQNRIAGIGNIYADEILFEAGLHPLRRLESLNEKEIKRLYTAIRDKLKEGVELRGTSVQNYVDGKGEKGGFQERLKVYNRGGQPCVRCGTALVKTVAAGRGTVFCPNCQR